MIYLDTSVLLAHVLGETRRPPSELWSEVLVSSRLLEYEPWNRIHAYGLAGTHGEATRAALASVDLVELSPVVLARAVHPFPDPVRTLDALHPSTLEYLTKQGKQPRLLSRDARQHDCAGTMGLGACELHR